MVVHLVVFYEFSLFNMLTHNTDSLSFVFSLYIAICLHVCAFVPFPVVTAFPRSVVHHSQLTLSLPSTT